MLTEQDGRLIFKNVRKYPKAKTRENVTSYPIRFKIDPAGNFPGSSCRFNYR
jgi:hypothetical protein